MKNEQTIPQQRIGNDQIEFLDSTIREGLQSEMINFSLYDRIQIAQTLCNFGINFIEVPAGDVSTISQDFLKQCDLQQLTVFTSTRRKMQNVEDNTILQQIAKSNQKVVTVFGKSSLLHVDEVLKTTPSENLKMIEDTILFLKKANKKVIFDAEHFFDAFKLNADYAIATLQCAINSKADVICLCDTNGGTMPLQVYNATKAVVEKFPNIVIGIHCHDDCGLADANTLLAVEAGARHVQGTFLGVGERCGNASLVSVIANLKLKMGMNISDDVKTNSLKMTANKIAEIANISIHKKTPFVGSSAFAHKAGMHADGVIKNSSTFEHISPSLVGNERKFLLSEMSGRGVIIDKISSYYKDLKKDDARILKIVNRLKENEKIGYVYESAEASFFLLVKKIMDDYQSPFSLISINCTTKIPSQNGALCDLEVRASGKNSRTSANGEGPVNAMDKALRDALKPFYCCVENVTLSDYKVRVMNQDSSSNATVRVLLTSTDGKNTWTTVGVSKDIIEASWQALYESFEYAIINKN